MLVYRSCRCCRRIWSKMLHTMFHLLAIPCIVVGFIAAWDYHELQPETPIPHLYSIHSWMGNNTISGYISIFPVSRPGHHGNVPASVRLWRVQLPPADVLLLLHCLLQVLHGPHTLQPRHHHLPHGHSNLYCRHHWDCPLQTQVVISEIVFIENW